MVNTDDLRLVPSTAGTPSTVTTAATCNDLGVHDTLRYGPSSLATSVRPSHPLEHRLKHWEETQMNARMTLQRRIFGIHAPVRQLMEQSIVAKTRRHPTLPSSNLGLDILRGKDETIDVDDIFSDPFMSTEMVDVPAVMARTYGV
ncbi:proteasome maturation factor UMP1-domain-containing protein [Syncephalis plumigaleata]|nr:proteasome maturation factor UMP1-domain-containing protein [Syncephalis plumigaleata]